MSSREGPPRPMFGKVDPYCLLAVLPMLLVAGIVVAMLSALAGLGVVVVAGLIVVFDSWANRPGPVRSARHPRPRPQARPAPVVRSRPPTSSRNGYGPRPGPRQPAPGAPYRR
ncbi:hypothetical protein [Amycolatopsis sp. NPDC051371]|uniref:hypothetical protein n=1 Tax=Amycolatopsis sp. NPDC051371 TaxID=3155800 RepID=UPI0034148CC4